jgi:hypothetical protein
MVENRRLLIALAIVLLVGIGARFGLTKVRLDDGVYYSAAPNETPSFKALEAYVCPKCLEAIYKAYPERMHSDEARHVLETYRLLYTELPEGGHCPNHPEQPLVRTPEIPVDPGAKTGLPPDTEFICRVYRAREALGQMRDQISLMIVISSRDKRSIHRPESCMAAQGWTLQTQQTVSYPSPSVPGGTLNVRSLLMERPDRDERGNLVRQQSVVLYWYAALPDRLTSSEYKRLATMFFDRLVKGSNYRWSYVLISRLVQPGQNPADVAKELERFVTEFTEMAGRGDNDGQASATGQDQ